TASYTFAGDANHGGSSDSKPFTIGKATSTTAVTCAAGPFTFTGSAQTPCSAAVTGAGGLNEAPTPTYADNTGAGTATASYTFAGDANHGGSSDSKPFTIGKATSTTAVTCAAGPFTFTGSAQTPCSAAVTGAGGLNEAPTPTYADNTGAGTATASYTFAGDANHGGSSDSKPFTIGQATSTTLVSCAAGPFTFTGSAQTPCSVAVTGAGGLNEAPTPTYADNTNAGTATASYTFAGDANHGGSSDSKPFTIGQATSTTLVSCAAGPFTFTGSAQTPCSVAVTGAGGLNEAPTPTYADNTNAGTATASYTFAGDANHAGSNGSKTFAIGQAASTVTVTCPATAQTYTGAAIDACTATVTGANLNLTVTPTYGNNLNVGTATASYTFVADANHTGSTDSKTFAIASATWRLSGFYQPVTMTTGATPIYNTVKGGSTVPLKFNIYAGGVEQKLTSAVKAFRVMSGACTGQSYEDPVDVVSTGGTSLRYDATGAQFVQNWQTPKPAGQCYLVVMTARDGSTLSAYFKTK